MSKKRTKKQRQHAALHRKDGQSFTTPMNTITKNEAKKTSSPVTSGLPGLALKDKVFSFDPQIIKKDLLKTVAVTVVVLLVLILITLRYT